LPENNHTVIHEHKISHGTWTGGTRIVQAVDEAMKLDEDSRRDNKSRGVRLNVGGNASLTRTYSTFNVQRSTFNTFNARRNRK